jgi:hypothetical protein
MGIPRVSPWGARGRASNRGGGTASKSRCWQARQRAWLFGQRRRDVEEQGGPARGAHVEEQGEGQRGVGSSGRGAGAARGVK